MTGAVCIMAGGGESPRIRFTPPIAQGSGTGTTITSNIVTASVSVGTGYTFLWSYVLGDSDLTPGFPLDYEFMRWSTSTIAPGSDKNALWKCEAFLGPNKVAEDTINVFLQRF